ncbi:MAG: transcriptional repressor [Tannerellaceae bacterium]|jgi:Fur family ferric uptake transcriptional regulator|nr:transcriptional repressor [Tannerellaceae bacterium]
MEKVVESDLHQVFVKFLKEQKFRFTEEREVIFRSVCDFPGHFNLKQLRDKLEGQAFHVTKATLYSTLSILVEAGILVKHSVPTVPLYELKRIADKHVHLFCVECDTLTDVSGRGLRVNVQELKIRKFTVYSYNVYIFGVCSKCAFRLRQDAGKRENK